MDLFFFLLFWVVLEKGTEGVGDLAQTGIKLEAILLPQLPK